MADETLISVIKRTGEKVPYNSQKIASAIQKAFHSSKENIDESTLALFTEDLKERLMPLVNSYHSIHIEQIQDAIEQELMRKEYFLTAKKFIIYRQRHAEQRLLHTMSGRKKINTITVHKRDGNTEPFNLNKILVCLRNASTNIDTQQVPLDPIVMELEKNVFDGIHTKDIEEALVLSTTVFIEKDPGYDIISTKLLQQKLYKEVLQKKVIDRDNFKSEMEKHYKNQFVLSIKKGIEKKYFSERLLEFDLIKMSESLVGERDNLLSYLGLRTLYERYFVKDNKLCLETPQIFWMRVAMGLALNETNKEEMAIQFYTLISQLRYIPSTPTLFHAGLVHPQLSSCYISTVADDLSNIFKCIGDNAQMAKWSGGIGNDWTSVRATNSLIKSTNVESQGVIPFLKIANDTTLAINRSGKRRGATCAYLETWHLDIEDFIDLRRNTGDDRRRTHDMNIAIWVPDLFMKRVDSNAEWTLFSPSDVPDLHETYGADFESRYIAYEKQTREGAIEHFRTVNANKLWKKMLTRLFETGHPWITFKDPCNIRSPQDHVGVIHSSNLCTEITLNNSSDETAVCNLGSINLSRHVSTDGINQYLLIDTIKTAMRMLDNVIDINFYPTEEAKKSNLKHRPVGLGIMGLQDVLYNLRIPFTGQTTIEFMDKTMELISYYAILSSSELAKERGAYPSFKGSKWDRGIMPLDTVDMLEKERGEKILVDRNERLDWDSVRNHIKAHGMRNSNTMAIAPTATISNIAGCFPCIEPIYKNIYVKANMNGEFTIINQYLVNDLKALQLWTPKMLDVIKYYDGNIDAIDEIPEDLKRLYKETFEIDSIDLLKLTAVRAKWIDQSQSHNVFIKGASGKKLYDTYMQAWKMGLKTTYYLRTLAASQIEKSTLDAKEFGYTQKREYNLQVNQGANVQVAERTVERVSDTQLSIIPNDDERQEVAQQFLQPIQRAVDRAEDRAETEIVEQIVERAVSLPQTQRPETQRPETKTPATADREVFQLNVHNAASDVGKACSLLDPECESCQ